MLNAIQYKHILAFREKNKKILLIFLKIKNKYLKMGTEQ